MVDHHREVGAGVTVAAIPVPEARGAATSASSRSTTTGRILAFHEKVADPPTMPGDPTRCLASMGNYVFDTKTLIEIVTPRDDTYKDLGGDVIPALTARRRRPRLRLLDERRARAGRARAGLLARRRDDRRLLRRQHGPDRPAPGVQPLQRQVAGVHATAAPSRRRRCRGARAASRRTSTAACCARARSCRAPTSSARSSRPACTSTTTPTSPTRSCSRASASVPAPGCTAASSTRTSTCPPWFRVGLDGLDADRFTVSPAGITVIEKDRQLT